EKNRRLDKSKDSFGFACGERTIKTGRRSTPRPDRYQVSQKTRGTVMTNGDYRPFANSHAGKHRYPALHLARESRCIPSNAAADVFDRSETRDRQEHGTTISD